MERKIVGKQPTFRSDRKGNNFYRIILWISLILATLWFYLGLQRGQIVSPLEPTPTPTRIAESYFLEAQAYFDAGKLDDPSNATPGPDAPPVNDAIDAYKAALQTDDTNARAWSDLARIQAYSSSMLRNDQERLERLEEAKASADKAIELAPDDSTVRAVRAFVLDWYAFSTLVSEDQRQELLIEAETRSLTRLPIRPRKCFGAGLLC